MIRKRPFTWIGVVAAVALGTVALPQTSAAQSVKDTSQQILDLLRSWGEVTRSWSAALPAAERFVVLACVQQ